MSITERVRSRMSKLAFLWWAKRLAKKPPHPEALAIWQQVAAAAETVSRAQLLDDIPHILEKDTTKPWWHLSNYYPFFYGIGKTLQPRSYLEIGTRYGYSMISLYCGARENLAKITSIDLQAYENTSQNYARANLLSKGFDKESRFIIGSSAEAAIQTQITGERFDLVFVDGDHSYEGAKGDVCHYWHHVAPGGFMMIDDVFWQLFSMGKKVLRGVKDSLPYLADMDWYEFIGAGVAPKPSYDGLTLDDFIDKRTGLIACYRGLVLIKKQL